MTEAQKKRLLEILGAELGPMVRDAVKAQIEAMRAETSGGSPATALVSAARGTASPTGATAEVHRENVGMMLSRVVRALAISKGDREKALAFVKREWSGAIAIDATVKALEASTDVAGGVLVTPQVSADVIEFLRPQVIVRRLGARVVPMPTGTLRLPKHTGASTASYIGEGQDIPKTEQTFGLLMLTWKKLAALVPISNDLLRFATPNVDTIVRDDVVRSLRTKEDVTFIRATGSAASPKGIRNWIPAANLIAANATINLANVTVDLGKLVVALLNADIPMITPGWMMAPRTWNYLMTVRDTNGNFAFRDELLQGRLWGWPFGITTQIPINLGGGADESEIYLVDFADVVIGESENLIIDASTEAAYVESGALVSAFSRDQTLVRVIAQHDIGLRHDGAGTVLTAVKWV